MLAAVFRSISHRGAGGNAPYTGEIPPHPHTHPSETGCKLRSLSLTLLATSLVALISACNTSTPTAGNTAAPATSSPGVEATPTAAQGHHSGKAKVNVNTAILSELDKFEAELGVPALSHKIQASRPYASIEELVSKKVVTQEQFDKIKDRLTTEEIILTGEAKDVDYMTKLGLMKGHLLVAKELLDLGKPAQAEPHIGHPVEEIYVDVEDQLQERGVPEFKTPLTRLQDLVKSKPKDPKVTTEYNAAITAIETAIAALPAPQRQSPAFVLQVINELLDTASSEYTAAIADGKISAAIEYQDSRGFVWYAHDTLYASIKAQLAQEKPAVNQQLQAAFQKLRTAWPSPLPPATPVISSDDLAKVIQGIQRDGQTVMAAKTP